jgi:hypothetical protein
MRFTFVTRQDLPALIDRGAVATLVAAQMTHACPRNTHSSVVSSSRAGFHLPEIQLQKCSANQRIHPDYMIAILRSRWRARPVLLLPTR